MAISQQILALLLLVFAGCADDMPVTARYVPEDCPPTAAPAEQHDEDDPTKIVDAARSDASAPGEDVSPPADPAPAAAPDELVDLNHADTTRLETLPGVGPALASRIIEYRSKRRFEAIDELQRVRGIGPAKFAKLRTLVWVGGSAQKRTP